MSYKTTVNELKLLAKSNSAGDPELSLSNHSYGYGSAGDHPACIDLLAQDYKSR